MTDTCVCVNCVQVRSGYRSQGAVSMGPKHKKKHTFSMPVRDREARRIKTLPADIQWGKGRPSSGMWSILCRRDHSRFASISRVCDVARFALLGIS